MPKIPTFPTLFDEVKTINITKLKSWGYLKPNQFLSGKITWSIGEQQADCIGIAVNTFTQSPYLELNYKVNGKPINYRILLITKPSNLGKGVVWYFLCPHTGKHCRKLYLIDTHFLHRSAFKGCMYSKQTYAKSARELVEQFSTGFELDKLSEELYKKYAKRYYKGKPTKLMNKVAKLEKIFEELSQS